MAQKQWEMGGVRGFEPPAPASRRQSPTLYIVEFAIA